METVSSLYLFNADVFTSITDHLFSSVDDVFPGLKIIKNEMQNLTFLRFGATNSIKSKYVGMKTQNKI